jgi:hypothetical protein
MRVAKIVEPERRDATFLDRPHQWRPDPLVEVGVVQRQAGRGDEDEVVRCRAGDPAPPDRGDLGGDLNRPI